MRRLCGWKKRWIWFIWILVNTPFQGCATWPRFYKGSKITYFDLMMHFDVQRDRTVKLKQVTEKTWMPCDWRINLYHWPGAGGTTIARRVAWDVHENNPTVWLKTITGVETVSRLRALFTETQLPLLVVVEAADVTDAALESLYSDVIAHPFPVVFLRVIRRFGRHVRETERVFLDSTLSLAEATRFVEAYSREEPLRRNALEAAERAASPKHRNPFYFGLVAFGEDFTSLEKYVRTRLDQATALQKRILTFIALAYHYAQNPLPIQLFTGIWGISEIQFCISIRSFRAACRIAREGEGRGLPPNPRACCC